MADPGKLWPVLHWGLDAGELWLDPWDLRSFAHGVDPLRIAAEAHLKDFGKPLVDGDIEVSEALIRVVIGSLFR